ncbi:MAG TPA: GIY-YIG nuclease family protein [Gemmatimonadales bacterium]|jgi:putative endonuclease
MKTYTVYILASRTRRLYIGVTSDLFLRVFEHRHAAGSRFTSRYSVNRLVHFEQTTDALSAIAREKQVNGWLRARKIALIESGNPDWDDLLPDCGAPVTDPSLRSG